MLMLFSELLTVVRFAVGGYSLIVAAFSLYLNIGFPEFLVGRSMGTPRAVRILTRKV